MDAKAKAEEFFETIVKRKKSLIEIPLNCSQGETGALLYLTFVKNGIETARQEAKKWEKECMKKID